MLLRAYHFMRHSELTDFVNTNAIPRASIIKIDADGANGGWVMWWYA